MPSVPSTFTSRPSTPRGTSRAIYAVTGVDDEVNDLIVPGAFARTLASRRVKAAWHHKWESVVGVTRSTEEWLPGDPRFAQIPPGPDGKPWPKEAGALVSTVAYNLRTTKGRDAYEQVKQWHENGEAAFSIGYRVPAGGATRRGDGVRVIHDLDLFEVSPVLHGAHPLTRSLEVKSSEPDGMEYKATASPHLEVDVDEPETGTIKVAGLAVKATDTGRLLMIQRALDDDDPAAGTWEFPGGHLDGDEDALAAALREWEEETGSPLPGTISVVGSWTAPNGIYRGFVAVVPTESAIPLNLPHDKRRLTNPDDPKGDAPEVTAWWPITALPDMPLLRPECRETPWSLLAGATLPQGPAKPADAPVAAEKFTAAAMAHPGALGDQEEKSARAAVRAARGRPPRIEHKSARAVVAEIKSRLIPSSPEVAMSHQPLPESQEQFRSRLHDSVRELLGQDEGTWVCIVGTYPDHAIVTVETESPGGSPHYSVPYTVAATGDITLGAPQPVELATVVVPDGTAARRAATADEDVDARIVQPAVEALTDATARVSSTTAAPEQLDGVRARVEDLIAALSKKGLDVGPAPARTPSTSMDLWDSDTFPNTGEDDDEDEDNLEDAGDATTEEPSEGETVHLDEDEVKSALALLRS
ncbi:NUDIX domain-containing protein [Streptomyces anulatus]|uniref:NUDIX domain-containing protein n=1 Tax=Streptomyces anulatus TaxID=1892 RepID=UPI003662F081